MGINPRWREVLLPGRVVKGLTLDRQLHHFGFQSVGSNVKNLPECC